MSLGELRPQKRCVNCSVHIFKSASKCWNCGAQQKGDSND